MNLNGCPLKSSGGPRAPGGAEYSPDRCPLPITETGYRSHFIAASTIVAAGGPVAYVDLWLTAESDTPAWRKREQSARQLGLF